MSDEAIAGKRGNWIWYFIALALVAGVLLLWLVLFIQVQLDSANQLKPEELRAARELWKKKGPKSYDMVYTVKRGGQGVDTYYVVVRGGEVQSVLMNGKTALEKDKLDYHSMTGLFRDIELFLQRDAKPDSPKTFCRGYFSGDDGRLILFVRRVRGSGEAVEIEVKEFKPVDG
jgi:hypothetical protein